MTALDSSTYPIPAGQIDLDGGEVPPAPAPACPQIVGVHPYAEQFPLLSDGELTELAESIRANGLRQPIVVTPDGLILDGRNRHAACQQAGVEPVTEVYDGDDLAEYVIDCNATRRNIRTSQRAMSTALVLAADGRREDGRWSYGAQKLGNVGNQHSSTWRVAISQCGTVLDFAPDLAPQVVNGDLALDAAFRKAEDRRAAERNRLAEQERRAAEEADARTFVEENAPDLAAQVSDDGPFHSYAEAQVVWEKRNREEAERLRKEKEAAERKAAQERKARTDLYSGIAKCVQTAAVYGRYEDVPGLMAEFNPAELDPPQYAREFRPDNLRSAARFMTELAKWMENNP